MRRLLVLGSVTLALLLSACSSAGTQPAATPQPPTPAAAVKEEQQPATSPTAPPKPTTPPPTAAKPANTPQPAPATPASGTFDPAAFTLALRPAIQGLQGPVGIANAGDGSNRLFIVQRGGQVRVARDGQLVQAPFLDVASLITSQGSEQGLLGLAFHPRYRENGLFFINYTDRQGQTNVVRYRVSNDPNVADPGSAKRILLVEQPFANHNGGNLVFGPDGYLWIGLGDGGSGGDPRRNGQDPDVLLGKMLRIDVDNGDPYAIPPDNPYVNGGGRPEVWAIGLRNPWRYSFDRATGDLYIADVGQNAWEEVSFTAAGTPGGLNYGWNRMEGRHCFPAGASCDQSGLVLPVAEYARNQGNCSVTGGHVYRGRQFPSLAGAFYYGDFCSGRIWALARDAGGAWQATQVFQQPSQLSAFGEDEAGELYVAGYGNGVIYQLTATGR